MNKMMLVSALITLCCFSGFAEQARRNIAREATASSNSEFKQMPMYRASNVIDGNCSNKGHGKDFPSWGPDLIPDPWLKLEWKQDVLIDSVTVYIRCDFPPYQPKEHDSWWESGTLEFSTGEKIPFKLKKTADAQTIAVPPQTIRWLKFTDLVAVSNTWCSFCEVEVMGRVAE